MATRKKKRVRVAATAPKKKASQKRKRPVPLHAPEPIAGERAAAARRGWAVRRAEEAARAAAAKKGWETRRARAEERQERARRKAEGVEAAKRTKAAKKALTEKRREQANKLWEERRKLAAEISKHKRSKAEGPSPFLRSLFKSGDWFRSGWYRFPDTGEEEGQIEVPAGGQPRARSVELEQFLLPLIVNEPVWIQCGVTARPPGQMSADDLARYEKYAGMQMVLTFPRAVENAPLAFVGMREVIDNMRGAGFRIMTLVVRLSFGERPARYNID